MSVRSNAVGAVRAVTGIVPDGVLARLLPPSLRWDQQAMQVSTPPNAPVRLLVAPTNSAGQAFRWAQSAERELSGVGASNVMTSNARTAKFAFPADLVIPETGYLFAHGWQKSQRRAIVTGFTHLLLESGRYPYGPVPWRTPTEVVQRLGDDGVAVALLWHGSDIRLPSAHAAWEADSPFGVSGKYPKESTAILEANAKARRQMVADTDLPVFVSTPGLLDVPRARWLPVVVDPDIWQCSEVPLQSSRPVVAYVPSNSAMKGDESVDVALSALEEEGLIRYTRLEGVPSSEMPSVYRSADIVIDQFRLGDYGVAACEAMAAGRVVVGHVHDEVREKVLALTGRELPIIESRYSQISETIRQILANPTAARVRAAEGVAYVEAVHNGRASARQLSAFLDRASDPSISEEGLDV